MRNRMYGGVRGRKMKVGRKLLRFPPTRFTIFKVAIYPRNTQSYESTEHTEYRVFSLEFRGYRLVVSDYS